MDPCYCTFNTYEYNLFWCDLFLADSFNANPPESQWQLPLLKWEKCYASLSSEIDTHYVKTNIFPLKRAYDLIIYITYCNATQLRSFS